jgi:deoxyhypusine synthase
MKNIFLKNPTKPLKVRNEDISELLEDMKYIGFQGRKLGELASAWVNMLREDRIVIFMGLAGAMVPAGMRRVMAYLIRKRMIDVLVSSGANLYHDCHEALGRKHYLGTQNVNDLVLRKHCVDRIYDVFASEKGFYKTDLWIDNTFAQTLRDGYPYSTREILELLGKKLTERKTAKNSILVSAYRAGVPIFCPAINDSSLGFSIMFSNRPPTKKQMRDGKVQKNIIIDCLKDVSEISRICERAKKTGGIYIGGGVPKNYIQQSAVIASYRTRHDRSHKYGLQITMDSPQWGGLSGCTLEESQSWGKYDANATMVTCYCDATIGLPIVAHALMQRADKIAKRRRKPHFIWKRDSFELKFE